MNGAKVGVKGAFTRGLLLLTGDDVDAKLEPKKEEGMMVARLCIMKDENSKRKKMNGWMMDPCKKKRDRSKEPSERVYE